MKFEECKKGMKVSYYWFDFKTGKEGKHEGIIYKVSKDKIKANQVVLIQGHKDKMLVFTHEALLGVKEK